jgi:antirestriction protein ArdC
MKEDKLVEEFANKFIEDLEKYGTDWKIPWMQNRGMQHNGISGREYGGMNIFTLTLNKIFNGKDKPYTDNRWFTFNNIQKYGKEHNCTTYLKKGERASTVVYIYHLDKITNKEYDGSSTKDMTEDEKKEYEYKNVIGMRGYHSVFNAEQIYGILPENKITKETSTEEVPEIVKNLIDNSFVEIKHINDESAFYSPSLDFVNIPDQEKFKSIEKYCLSLFHELGHATGHESRLNRELVSSHTDTEKYAKEELVAEFSAILLAYKLDIDLVDLPVVENSAAYINNWKKQIKEDPKVLFDAYKNAKAASDYIYNSMEKAKIKNQTADLTKPNKVELKTKSVTKSNDNVNER